MDPNYKMLKETDLYHPSGIYGVSKVFGEALGKCYSNHKNYFDFVALRIGWVSITDDPNLYVGTSYEDYTKAIWNSVRDAI